MFRILLAEDEQVMRAYLARALERSGYEVVAVDSGTAAAPLLEAERFDLLLTDIIMPEMDGIQLAHHCNMVSPTTDVIFINGFSGVALRAGASVASASVPQLANPSASRVVTCVLTLLPVIIGR